MFLIRKVSMSFRIFDEAMWVVIRAVGQIEEGMRQFMANDFPHVPLLVLQSEIGNHTNVFASESQSQYTPIGYTFISLGNILMS